MGGPSRRPLSLAAAACNIHMPGWSKEGSLQLFFETTVTRSIHAQWQVTVTRARLSRVMPRPPFSMAASHCAAHANSPPQLAQMQWCACGAHHVWWRPALAGAAAGLQPAPAAGQPPHHEWRRLLYWHAALLLVAGPAGSRMCVQSASQVSKGL
jgi:hypothetical protein